MHILLLQLSITNMKCCLSHNFPSTELQKEKRTSNLFHGRIYKLRQPIETPLIHKAIATFWHTLYLDLEFVKREENFVHAYILSKTNQMKLHKLHIRFKKRGILWWNSKRMNNPSKKAFEHIQHES